MSLFGFLRVHRCQNLLQEVGDRLRVSGCAVRPEKPQRCEREPEQQRGRHQAAGDDAHSVAVDKLPQLVASAGGPREDGFVGQVPLNVGCQLLGGLVTSSAIFFQRLHHNPVQVAAKQLAERFRLDPTVFCNLGKVLHRTNAHGGARRFLFADDPLQFTVAGLPQHVRVKGRRASEQLVEQDSERIDVRPGVYVETRHLSLFRTHVLWCADELSVFGKECFFRQPLICRLRDAEVDDLRDRRAVMQSHQHVAWFEVTVNDAFLVRVLDGLANGDEEL